MVPAAGPPQPGAEDVAPAPCGVPDAASGYRVAHGQGYTRSATAAATCEVTATWCVDPHSAVKQVRLRLVNRGHRTLHLRMVGIVEWMMGANRADRGTVHTALFRQRLPPAHEAGAGPAASGADRAAVHAARARRRLRRRHRLPRRWPADADEAEDWTCDRREFFDARGRLVLPDHFGQRHGSGLDPCAALSTSVTLAAGDTRGTRVPAGLCRPPRRSAPAGHHGCGRRRHRSALDQRARALGRAARRHAR